MPVTPPTRKTHRNYVHCRGGKQMKSEEDSRRERHRTLERYKRLLHNTSDPERRERLLSLIKEAEEKKSEAGDSNYQY
jgi:hypothetical protein